VTMIQPSYDYVTKQVIRRCRQRRMSKLVNIPADSVVKITVNMGNATSSKVPQKGKDSSILIVGGGTWGISIAYRLARRGYTNITVLDPSDILSSVAAGNDLNKILEERELHTLIYDPTCALTVMQPYHPPPQNKTTIAMHGRLSKHWPRKSGRRTPSTNLTTIRPALSTLP
jgi:hypothetical protein